MEELGKKIQSTYEDMRKKLKRKMSTASHKDASRYLEIGRKKYNAKKYDEAEKCFQKAVNADGQYALAHYYLGLVLYKRDDSEAALRAWNRTIVLDKHSEIAGKANRKIEQHQRKANQSIEHLKDRLKGRKNS